MRSISNIVYLLPLLFSSIANLGQLYATIVILSAWLLLGVQVRIASIMKGVFCCED